MIENNIQIGIAPINWSNDDMHEVGGHYSLDTILSEMTEAGYKGTEIGNKFPSTSLAIKKELDKYDLALASSWHSTFFLTADFDSEIESIKNRFIKNFENNNRELFFRNNLLETDENSIIIPICVAGSITKEKLLQFKEDLAINKNEVKGLIFIGD